VVAACRENPAGADGVPSPAEYNRDWTEATHGRVAPNYAIAFPQTAVNTIEITIGAVQWAAIRANMRTLWGFDFGAGGGGPGPGGFPSQEPAYVPVTLKFNGKVWKDVGFRLKGNSSLSGTWRQGNYKLPFRLNFDRYEDSLPQIDNQRFHGFKELSMSSGWSDASLIREKVAADIFRLAGIPAARTAFYRVFIDFGAGLKYCGVYAAVEVIDDTMVKDQFGEDAGNIYKPESNFRSFVAAQFEKKNNESPADYSDVQAVIQVLNATTRTTDPASWRSALEATFNVDHFLKWLAVNNAIVNWDTYGAIAHNYYLYNHSARKLTWIPWDHNLSLSGSPGITGTPGAGPGPGRALSLSMNEAGVNWPLIRYLADDSVYGARYRAHLRVFAATILSQPTVDALFDTYHALVAPHAIGVGGEQPGYSHLPNAAAFTGALPTLKAHIAARRTLVASFVPPL
jgi:hypothetical protein